MSLLCMSVVVYCMTQCVIQQVDLLESFYQTTLNALKEARNDRLWFKTNTKLGKLYYDRADWQRLQKILRQLRNSCQVCSQLYLLVACMEAAEYCYLIASYQLLFTIMTFLFCCRAVKMQWFEWSHQCNQANPDFSHLNIICRFVDYSRLTSP